MATISEVPMRETPLPEEADLPQPPNDGLTQSTNDDLPQPPNDDTQSTNDQPPNDDAPDEVDDLGDLGDPPQERKKRPNRAALEFETFVGAIVSEHRSIDEKGNLTTTTTRKEYDKIWNDLFLKRIALFPTLEEASLQAMRETHGVHCPSGTVKWFEGFRPTTTHPEVFHLERLLLRMREWAVEVRPVKHELLAFADKMQNKTGNVKCVNQFAEHRFDMLKKFTSDNWMMDATDYVEAVLQEDLKAKEELEKKRKEETLQALKNIGRKNPVGTVKFHNPNGITRQKNGTATVNFPNAVSAVSSEDHAFSRDLKARKERLIELKRKKEAENAIQQRKAALLEKKRLKQERAQMGETASMSNNGPEAPT